MNLETIKKVDILAVGVHPDDVELSCSGTLLKHIAGGRSVGLLDLTKGELGTRGSAAVRKVEALESARLMGALFRINLEMEDGFFQYNPENIRIIIAAIRACRPSIVLANALQDRHSDHGRAAKLVADACFYSGLVKIETTDEQGAVQGRWRPQAVYHYIQDQQLQPDFVVDITGFLELKMQLIKTFRSQFYLPQAEEFQLELDSPISGKDFLDFIQAKARVFGRPIGVEFAEGFNISRTVGVNDLFHLL